MGLVWREVSSGGCWSRSESRESCEGERTALSPLSADTSLETRPWREVTGSQGVKVKITAGGRSQD